VTKNARSGGMVPFEGVDLVELDALQIRPPLANYSAGLADLSRGAGLKNASVAGPTWVFLSGKSGPTFSYLSEFSGENFSAVEISVNEAGQAEWDSANTGLFSHLLEIVHHRLPALPEVRAGTFEPRLVVGLPTYPSFVWLKSTTDDNDFIYPVGVEFARPLEEQLYPAAEFLKIYQDVLKERNPEVKLVMPPVSTANPNIPIPTTPSHLTSKVTALVRIALAGAADAISDGDWELGPEFTLSESSHGCRIAWIAPGRDTDKRHLVVDGVAGTEYDGIADVHFSADGRHVAYLATTEGQGSQAVVDGKPGPLFKDACEELLLSPDGQHYAFTTEPPGHCQMVEDGQAGPAFNSVLQAGFSTDGQHLCYLGMNTLADGTRASQIVMDGKTGPVITGEIRTLVLGPDGQHCAYVRAAARTEQIVVDGIPGRSFQTVDQLCFSPDGKHFAYLGKTSGVTSDAQVVLDGQPSPSLGEAGQSSILRFSPDGQHFAYVTHSHVVLDGKSGLSGTPALATEFRPEGGGFIFSANSAHTAYIMNDDKAGQQAVVDGQPGPAFPGHVYDLTLSSDGRHSAFAVEFGRFEHGGNPTIFHQGNWEVVLDGQPGPKFDAVGPRFAFSPDGNHVAYAAETAKQWRVYADGTTGPAFDHIVAGPVVCNDGRLEYLALQKDGTATNLVRVTMPGFVPATP